MPRPPFLAVASRGFTTWSSHLLSSGRTTSPYTTSRACVYMNVCLDAPRGRGGGAMPFTTKPSHWLTSRCTVHVHNTRACAPLVHVSKLVCTFVSSMYIVSCVCVRLMRMSVQHTFAVVQAPG